MPVLTQSQPRGWFDGGSSGAPAGAQGKRDFEPGKRQTLAAYSADVQHDAHGPHSALSTTMSGTALHSITTVRGSVPAEDLGVTLPHEHVHCDFSTLSGSEDHILTNTPLTIQELAYFRAAGGRSVIEVTPEGTGRNPTALRAISEASGVQIVCGIGLYDQRTWPAWASEADAGRIADWFVQEIESGSGGVCAGVIG
jgi:hypothetical protein